MGLLESAPARLRATAYGADAYSDLHVKEVALLPSLVTNQGIVEGHERIAPAGVIASLGVNVT